MLKKFLFGASSVALAVATVPLFAAFEAHVINVTARIENALRMDVTPIEYGTVFPQEELDRFVDVSLSQSFIDEPRVDDVEYVIRQKPKCGLPISGTDPLEYSAYAQVTEDASGNFLCPQGYVPLPLLCPYLSKNEETPDGRAPGGENDSAGIPAFHGAPINQWTPATTVATQVKGRLAKSEEDFSDRWKIDLKAPCFEGNCDQGWQEFVRKFNPSANPLDYIQPRDNEHEIFGCDLWFEVFGISLPGIGCNEKADVLLVLDRSGSIDSTELGTLKSAAHAFVGALAPSSGGVHMGQSSFALVGTLDLHLTGVQSDIDAAIDALSSGGRTNLLEGITRATEELDNSHEHERAGEPDFMVIITDGNPNEPNQNETLDKAAAKGAADLAKSAGIEIFVVGVGSDVDADFLRNDIASGADHYFSAADFSSLAAELEKIASCNQ